MLYVKNHWVKAMKRSRCVYIKSQTPYPVAHSAANVDTKHANIWTREQLTSVAQNWSRLKREGTPQLNDTATPGRYLPADQISPCCPQWWLDLIHTSLLYSLKVVICDLSTINQPRDLIMSTNTWAVNIFCCHCNPTLPHVCRHIMNYINYLTCPLSPKLEHRLWSSSHYSFLSFVISSATSVLPFTTIIRLRHEFSSARYIRLGTSASQVGSWNLKSSGSFLCELRFQCSFYIKWIFVLMWAVASKEWVIGRWPQASCGSRYEG